MIIESAGGVPTVVPRPAYRDGALRIVARAGGVTQTRVYAVTISAHRIDLKSTGKGMQLPPALSMVSLTLGAHGEIVEPPHSSDIKFASSADYEAYRRDNNHDPDAGTGSQERVALAVCTIAV